MGRRRQPRETSGPGLTRKAKGGTRVEKCTTRDRRVPTVVRDYRRSAAQELSGTLRTPPRGHRNRTPFKILIFWHKGKAKRIIHKPVGAGCRGVPASVLTKSPVGHHEDHETSNSGTPRTSNKVRKWHAAVAPNPTQVVVKVKSSFVQSGGSLPVNPAAVHLSSRGTARDVITLPQAVLSKPKKKSLQVCTESKSTSCLVPTGGGIRGPGPCTRSRAGRIHGASDTVPSGSRPRSGGPCLKGEVPCIGRAGYDKEKEKCTARHLVRKRGREADTDFSCNCPTSLLGADVQQTSLSAQKKRRLTQRSLDRGILKGSTVANRTQPSPSKAACDDGGVYNNVGDQQPIALQCRQGSRRRGRAKQRGSQTSPRHKIVTAPPALVHTSSITTVAPQQTKPPCFLYWPKDPTRPFCRPAIAFEPADLRLGFNGVLEWPCVVTNAAAESPECISQTDEQPRFSLCGGLPDPPRSPPWVRRAALTSGGECRGGSFHRDSLHRSADAPLVTNGALCDTECREEIPDAPHMTSGALCDNDCREEIPDAPHLTNGALCDIECREEMPHEQCCTHTASASPTTQAMTTAVETRDDISEEDDRSQSSSVDRKTIAVQLPSASLEKPFREDEYDDWIFTPPDPDRAQVILNYMEETIRRIIATTQAAQRRTEMYSRVFERLLHIGHQSIF